MAQQEPSVRSKKPLTPHANRRREVKEIKTKLGNLSPLATAEVVNGAVTKQVGKQMSGFTNFLREQGVVGLAIGLIFGIQVKAVVDQFMVSFINPFLTLVLPGSEDSFAKKSFSLTIGGNAQKFVWGQFFLTLLTLIIVAAIMYVTFNLLRLNKLAKKKDK